MAPVLFDLVPSLTDTLCAAAAAAAQPPADPAAGDDEAFSSPLPLTPVGGGEAEGSPQAKSGPTEIPPTPVLQPLYPTVVEDADAGAAAAAEEQKDDAPAPTAAAGVVAPPTPQSEPQTPQVYRAAVLSAARPSRLPFSVDGIQAAGVALLAALLCTTPQAKRGPAWTAYVDLVVVRARHCSSVTTSGCRIKLAHRLKQPCPARNSLQFGLSRPPLLRFLLLAMSFRASPAAAVSSMALHRQKCPLLCEEQQ